ncbi:MAG: translation initiation factor [Dissulfurispiraceae bacterium]|jgi:translation initiation factor 1
MAKRPIIDNRLNIEHSVLILFMSGDTNRTVYSTECDIPKKGQIDKAKAPNEIQTPTPASRQKIYVRLDRKGRGGKAVTQIEGLQMAAKDREALVKQLKAQLGTGGAVKDAVIQIQGDHRDALITLLESLGFRPKRSGG